MSSLKLLTMSKNAAEHLGAMPEYANLPADEKLSVLKMLVAAQECAIQTAVYTEMMRKMYGNLPGQRS